MTAKLLRLPPREEKSSALWDSLQRWRATETVPAEIIQNLPALQAEAKASLSPASPEEMAVFLELLQQTAASLRWPPFAPGAPKIYATALADMPSDLLALALQRIQRDWKWPRMPVPADIREAVSEDFFGRKLRLSRLRSAEFYGRR